MNRLVRGDALELGRWVGAGAGRIMQEAQLAYLDPPFAVGARFGARTKTAPRRAEGPIAYDDRWPSIEAYLAWLEPRVRAVHSCLSPRGTMWLHLDHRAVHEAKLICDAIFDRARVPRRGHLGAGERRARGDAGSA